MTDALVLLSDADLEELARALRARRLEPPFAALAVQRWLSSERTSTQVAAELQAWAERGWSTEQLAEMAEIIRRARSQRQVAEEQFDLVVTGPEAPGIANRDTSVVVREMFSHAEQSVLVAGYAVYQGQKVFEALADRMEALPQLQVRLFLDVARGHGEASAAAEITHRFAERFRSKQWPKGRRLPEVFFDPRALEIDRAKRASLHAKCIVADRKQVFVSSANFTEAAQERNLEIGLLLRSRHLANRLVDHFDALLTKGLLSRVL